ncbi:MAG: folate-binding protein YgfZ [Hyphomicrobiaceae bacterium]|nr:folate-binding protein YgfZ [Hyphomicrobiaceae bacterium]
MSDTLYSKLPDRGVVLVSGPDVQILFEKLITNSLTSLSVKNAIHTGLLSPQGKILFDFFVTRAKGDLIIDIAHSSIDEFIERLAIYRLRSNVTFKNVSNSFAVMAAWGRNVSYFSDQIIKFEDPRLAELGRRYILPHERLHEFPGDCVSEKEYHAHRTIIGVPEAGHDFVVGNTFPHEALYDQLGSIDFNKGCFVGQEVVSRMQHRMIARKRIVPVCGDKPLISDSIIKIGDVKIGTIGSTIDNRGLALVRLDQAHEAKAKGINLMAGKAILNFERRSWLKLDLSTGRPLDEPS